MPTEAPALLPLYLQIAARLAQMVVSGAFPAGGRLPSVRDSAANSQVAVATVVQAYRHLEEHGVAQPRPKSGYFVVPAGKAKAAKLLRRLQAAPPPVGADDDADAPAVTVSFAGYSPKDRDLFDTERIRVALSRATRLRRDTLIEYTNSSGSLALRNAVAQRALHLGCTLDAENIVITTSCISAISICLQTVTRPGDMVAIESPTFFGFLDLLESLNLKAFELPTDPRSGISLPALQLALDTQPIKALLLVPTLSNPLGAVMPLAQKRALARLVAQYQLPLIEDLVFNDLFATDARRRAVKAYDTEGLVMSCGSFAKTVSPGIRIGWVDAGRWSTEVATVKRVQGMSTNAVLEHALADLLTQSNYEAHLRRLCAQMKLRLGQARKLVQQHFPAGTRSNDPPAGYALWVELPHGVDGMALFHACRRHGIAIAPGSLFCASQRYRHFLRLSFAGALGPQEQAALAEVGRQACSLVSEGERQKQEPQTATARPPQADVSRMDLMFIEEAAAPELW